MREAEKLGNAQILDEICDVVRAGDSVTCRGGIALCQSSAQPGCAPADRYSVFPLILRGALDRFYMLAWCSRATASWRLEFCDSWPVVMCAF